MPENGGWDDRNRNADQAPSPPGTRADHAAGRVSAPARDRREHDFEGHAHGAGDRNPASSGGCPRSGTPRVSVSYTHLRAHETVLDLVCRLLLEKKKKNK